MVSRLAISSAFILALATPAFAGPCTQRLAELEKSLTAHQEGAGPALSQPSATGSVGEASPGQGPTSGTNVTAQSQQPNQALRMVQEAKQLDQQGKEADCMAMVPRIESMVPAHTK
jgi:hypothetical protein